MSTRRRFLKVAAIGGVGAGLLGCGDDGTPNPDASASDSAVLDGSQPDGSIPDGSAPDSAVPDGSAADGTTPMTRPGAPTLFNFRVEAGNPTRVYFDSSEVITASTTVGFTVTGKELSGIDINPGSTAGHYFTVTSAFDYFQKGRMINYVGGSDMEDSDGAKPFAFRWQHIRNGLPQPEALRDRYVTISGAGARDGSLGNEWTFAEAMANVVAGDLVHVAPGNHGGAAHTLRRSGTPTNPIVFQGYETSPGDIDSLHWNYGDGAFDAGKMPYFNGGNRNVGEWLTLTDRDNVIVRNFQVEEYRNMVWSSAGSSQVYERLLCNHLGDPNDYSGIGLHSHGEDNSYLDCTVVNATAVNIRIMDNSAYNLIDGCKSYCDESLETGAQASTDYYFANQGSYNVTKNCHIERFGNLQHHGHGYTFKDIGGVVHDNLLEDSVVINIKQAIDLNLVAHDNIIRRVIVLGDPDDTGALDGGIKLAADTRDNVFEYCELSGFRDAAVDHESSTGDHSGNKLIGCVIRDVATLVGSAPTAESLEFIHCIIDGVTNVGSSLNSSNSFTNTTFLNVTNGAPNASYDHCNFHNSFATPTGVGNISEDPRLDANYRPTPATPAAVAEGGVLVGGAEYDADANERTAPVSIGAYEAAS